MKERKYDSTVARIAGNIASGLAPRYAEVGRQIDVDTLAETCVMIARAIAAETERTEHGAPQEEKP